jgi:hypothetical protein
MAFLASVILPTSAQAARPLAAAATTSTVHGLQAWAACVKGAGQGDLLVMIDASGSLRQTDADGKRIAATNFLIRQLRDVAGSSANGSDAPDIRIALSAFGEHFTMVDSWRPLGPPGQLESLVQSQFANRNTERDTDYLIALNGAQQSLAQERAARASAGGKASCQALVWISDGDYDIQADGRTERKPYAPDVPLNTRADAAKAVDLGYRTLCRPRGLVDGVRSEGVHTLSVGLRADQNANFERFQALAVGTAGPVTCGGAAPASGDFFLADHLEDLLQAIEDGFAGDNGGNLGGPECRLTDPNCLGHPFVLDTSVHAFRALSVADRAGLEVWLLPPDQSVTDGRAGVHLAFQATTAGTTQEVLTGAFRVEYRWETSRALSVSVTRRAGTADSGWAGRWWIRLVDPKNVVQGGQSWLRLTIQGDKQPYVVDLDSGAQLSLDARHLTFGVRNASGTPVDVTQLPGVVELDAILTDSAGTALTLLSQARNSAIGRPVTVDLSRMHTGVASIRLTLRSRTADVSMPGGQVVPGTWLNDEIVDLPLTIIAPPSYPQVETRHLDFGSLAAGVTQATAQIVVSGNGCVWVTAGRSTAVPEGVGGIQLQGREAISRSTCQRVNGQHIAVPVVIRADHVGDGLAAGTVVVSAVPSDADHPVEEIGTTVGYDATLQTKIDRLRFIHALASALALGLGVPILAWLLLCWRTARLPKANVDIAVTPLQDGLPCGPSLEATQRVGGSRATLDLYGGNSLSLRVRPGWWGGQGFVRPTAPRGQVLTVGPDNAVRSGRAVRLPRHLVSSWVVVEHGEDRRLITLQRSASTPEEQSELRAGVTAGLEVLRAASAAVTQAQPMQPPPADVGPPGRREGISVGEPDPGAGTAWGPDPTQLPWT